MAFARAQKPYVSARLPFSELIIGQEESLRSKYKWKIQIEQLPSLTSTEVPSVS